MERGSSAASRRCLDILVIDDNKALLGSLEALINMLGHPVTAAASGEEGLQLALALHPTLVLCDISLDGSVSGYRVAREIRDNPALSNTYLVAMSGNSSQADREKSAAAGFDRHVGKPFSVAELTLLMDDAWRHAVQVALRPAV